LVASDGSTDNTETIVRELSERDPRVELVRTKGRAGKSQAQNVAAQHASGEILLFTDVETRIPPDALQPILGNFSDPQVGLVTAVVNFPKGDGAVAGGQGFYWRYETFLRQMESDIGILATASGQLLAVRRSLFRPIDPQHGDDCIIPLDVCLHGFRVVQEPRAVVTDVMPHTIEGELRARIRMTTRNWTGTFSRPALLNPLRFPGTAWSLVSHKLLRWLTPFLLVSALISNTVLVLEHRAVLLWFTQAIFYLAAIVGWLRERKGQSAAPFSYAFCFCLANVGFMLGIVKAFRGQRTVAY
jgi:cellulose synthase/poly-beta-1,6-N-acetylglucosamine synthase-like glycosyltransferase